MKQMPRFIDPSASTPRGYVAPEVCEVVNGRAALDEVDNAATVFAGKGSVRAKRCAE